MSAVAHRKFRFNVLFFLKYDLLLSKRRHISAFSKQSSPWHSYKVLTHFSISSKLVAAFQFLLSTCFVHSISLFLWLVFVFCFHPAILFVSFLWSFLQVLIRFCLSVLKTYVTNSTIKCDLQKKRLIWETSWSWVLLSCLGQEIRKTERLWEIFLKVMKLFLVLCLLA